jgi:hypothetical protein
MAKKFIELDVPQTLNDITLEQYQKYMKVMDAHKDAEQTDELTNFLNMKLIEIFCNISLAEVDKISVRGFNRVLSILNKAFAEKPKLIKRFRLDGVDMGFIPKLDDIPKYMEQNLTKQDLQTLEKHLAKNGGGINQFMHSLKEMSLGLKQLPSYHFSSV